MKRTQIKSALCATGFALAATAGFAQAPFTPVVPATQQTTTTTTTSPVLVPVASGSRVIDIAGQPVGRIENIVMSPVGCAEAALVASTSGRIIPVPWNFVRASEIAATPGVAVATVPPTFVVNIDQARLLQAPSFTRAQMPDFRTTAFLQPSLQFFSNVGATAAGAGGTGSTTVTGATTNGTTVLGGTATSTTNIGTTATAVPTNTTATGVATNTATGGAGTIGGTATGAGTQDRLGSTATGAGSQDRFGSTATRVGTNSPATVLPPTGRPGRPDFDQPNTPPPQAPPSTVPPTTRPPENRPPENRPPVTPPRASPSTQP